MSIRIVGTGHVLQKSVDDVKEAIEEEKPDIVALELDEARFRSILGRFYGKEEKFKVGGGSFPLFMNFLVGRVLEKIQTELGKKFGVFPGQEMMQAIESARTMGSEIALIDRDIQITLNRLIATPLREKYNLLKLKKIDIDFDFQNSETLLDEAVVEKIMEELKANAPKMYSALVDERDKIMALSLYEMQFRRPDANIVAVVGAGHKKGVSYYLSSIHKGGEINIKDAMKMKPVNPLKVLVFLLVLIFAFILMEFEFFIRRRKR